MIRRLICNTKAGTIVEFALVAPLFCLIVVMILQSGIAFQRWNAAQAAAHTTARCLAIASPRCTTATPGNSNPGVTYAVSLSIDNGISGITADMIDIELTTEANGIAYQQVSIRVPTTILGQTMTLRAESRFPLT